MKREKGNVKMLIRLPGEISYLIGFLLISLGLLVDWYECLMNSHELLARGGVYLHTQLGFNPFISEATLRNYTCRDKRSEILKSSFRAKCRRHEVEKSQKENEIVTLSSFGASRSVSKWEWWKRSNPPSPF